MRRRSLVAGLSLLVMSASHAQVSDGFGPQGSARNWSLGVGFGTPYAGLGANLALAGTHDFKYLSAGCLAGTEHDDDWDLACGIGVGWMWTDLFAWRPNHQAIGVYLGPVGSQRDSGPDGKLHAVYGVGASYNYFFNGVGRPGALLGLTPVIDRRDGDTEASLMLNLGYQF